MTDWMMAIAGSAHHSLFLHSIVIALATFVLEDAATVFAAMQAQAGRIPVVLGWFSLCVGIVAGDVGLYALGALSRRSELFSRWITPERFGAGRHWLRPRVFQVVFVSRFLPGARLPTYVSCGYLGVSLRKFALATCAATLIWTSALFSISLHVGALMTEYMGQWRWAGAAGFIVVLFLLGRAASRLPVMEP